MSEAVTSSSEPLKPITIEGRNIEDVAWSESIKENIDHRKCNSLPPSYKHRKRPFITLLQSQKENHEGVAGHQPVNRSVDALEFQHRLGVIKEWMSDFSDLQKLSLLQGIFPMLGPNQLHWLDSQVPGKNPGLHTRCSQGCSDPLQILPPHVIFKIFSYLDPHVIVAITKVSWIWNQYGNSGCVWRIICNRDPWKLSTQATNLQIQRHSGELNWREMFIERYKLRRSWLAGQCHVRTFQGHAGGISCVQFDSSRIVSGSHDKTIKVWNTKTNSPWSVMTLSGHSGEVRCLHLQSNKLVSGSTDLTIKVWDLDIQQDWSSIACRVTMTGHSDTVRCVQMNIEKNIVISGSYDTTLKVWNLQSGACLNTLRGHSAPVLAIQVKGSRLISGSGDKTVRIWNLEDGSRLGILQGHRDAVTCLTVDSSDQRIITGSLDRTIKVWSTSTLECLRTLDWMSNEGHTGVIRCLAADEWRIISAADDKTIKVWNLETGRRLVTLRSHTDGVTCLQFNDFYIVSGSYDKTVKLWDFTVC